MTLPTQGRIAFALCAWLLAAPAAAAERGVRVTGHAPPEVRARIAGQIADLPWSVVDADGPAQAEAHIRRDPDGGWRVRMSDDHGRAFERRLEGAGEASAAFEALGLVVRSGLKELSNPPPPPPPPEVTPPPAPPTRWFAEAGGGVAAAAADEGFRGGVGIGGGLRLGAWRVGLAVELGLPATLADEHTEIRLVRHGLRLSAAAARPAGGGVAFFAGGAAGVMFVDRSAQAVRRGVDSASSSLTAAFVTGPQLGVAWELLRLTLGVDLVVGEPTLRYRVDGVERTRHEPWVFQPRLALAMAVGEGTD